MAKMVGGRKIFRKRRSGGRRAWRRGKRAWAHRGSGAESTSDEDYVVAEEEEEEEGSSYSDASREDAGLISESTSCSEEEEDDDEEEEGEVSERRRRPRKRPRPSRSRRKTKANPRKKSRVPRLVDEVEAPLMSRPRAGPRRGSIVSISDDGEEDEYEDDDDVDFAPEEDDADEEYLASSPVRKGGGRRNGSVKRLRKRSRSTDCKGGKDKKKAVKKMRRRNARSSDDDDFVVDDAVLLEGTNTKGRRSSGGRKRRAKRSKVASVSEDDDFVVEVRDLVERTIRNKKKKKSVSNGKKRRRRVMHSEASDSDFDCTISEEESKDLLVGRPWGRRSQKTVSSAAKGEEKRRGKEVEDVGKQVCGICLSEERKAAVRGVLDCCAHYFCFACIMEWSKVESRCPLCKQRFKTVSQSALSGGGLSVRCLVKRIPKRDQVYQPSEEEMRNYLDPYSNVFCVECQQGGDDQLMLLCDICDSAAHTYCVGLGREVPEGNWYCDGCRSMDPESSNSRVRESMVEPGAGNSNLSQDTLGGTVSENTIDCTPPETPQLSTILMSPHQLSGLGQDASSGRHSSLGDHGTPLPATGFAASTLSDRRSIHQRIQIMLFNNGIGWTPERLASNVVAQPSRVEGDIFSSEVDQARETLDVQRACPASGINVSSNRLLMTPRANMHPCTHNEATSFSMVEGTKARVRSMVKIYLNRLTRRNPLERRDFKDVARRATHTVLAACGARHDRRVVAHPFEPLPNCVHESECDLPELVKDCCSLCFDYFVEGVVRRLMDLKTQSTWALRTG